MFDPTKINALKTQLEAKKNEFARAEATRDALAKQRADLEAECAALGVTPDGLQIEITRLNDEIETGVAEVEQLLAGMSAPSGAAGVVA